MNRLRCSFSKIHMVGKETGNFIVAYSSFTGFFFGRLSPPYHPQTQSAIHCQRLLLSETSINILTIFGFRNLHSTFNKKE